MRLFLLLPVLVVALCMALEGRAPRPGSPDLYSTFKKDFGNTPEDEIPTATDCIKQIFVKTRNWFSETFSKEKGKFKDIS
jgi:hypothetical protein|uniref:Apolipoprotein C-I n=1 Tax=Castor canadensis TaxID=51338 RepID=A0A8C0WI53_CASCN